MSPIATAFISGRVDTASASPRRWQTCPAQRSAFTSCGSRCGRRRLWRRGRFCPDADVGPPTHLDRTFLKWTGHADKARCSGPDHRARLIEPDLGSASSLRPEREQDEFRCFAAQASERAFSEGRRVEGQAAFNIQLGRASSRQQPRTVAPGSTAVPQTGLLSIPDFSRDATATSAAAPSAHVSSSTMRGIACGAHSKSTSSLRSGRKWHLEPPLVSRYASREKTGLTLDRLISTGEVVRLKDVHTADWKIEDCGWREHVERAEEELRKEATFGISVPPRWRRPSALNFRTFQPSTR